MSCALCFRWWGIIQNGLLTAAITATATAEAAAAATLSRRCTISHSNPWLADCGAWWAWLSILKDTDNFNLKLKLAWRFLQAL